MKEIPEMNENIQKYKLNLTRFHSVLVMNDNSEDNKVLTN